MPIRLTLCWSGISGYMAACWRALARRPEVQLQVIAYVAASRSPDQLHYARSIVADLPCQVIDEAGLAHLADNVAGGQPDVVSIAGWTHPAMTSLPADPRLKSARFLLVMDTPWRGDWRQRLARFRLGHLMARMDRVVVPGERGWQYARHLGVPETRIRRGLYGIDFDALAPLWERRCARPEGWPRRFVFCGRYVPVKGLDVLLEAYQRYRAATRRPWSLTCCGAGPLAGLLRGVPGVEDRGFVGPQDLGPVWADSGASVLASRYEPWGVVVAEALAAGLPVLCTEACSSAVELVRPFYNGLLAATDDAAALARGMRWIEGHQGQLPEMGRRGRELAAAYSAQAWAARWVEMGAELMEQPGPVRTARMRNRKRDR